MLQKSEKNASLLAISLHQRHRSSHHVPLIDQLKINQKQIWVKHLPKVIITCIYDWWLIVGTSGHGFQGYNDYREEYF